MNVPTSLEQRIQDPVSLEPYSRAQVTNCQHRFSLETATQLFGEIINGAASVPSPCPICRTIVTVYNSDPEFQDMVDAILNSFSHPPQNDKAPNTTSSSASYTDSISESMFKASSTYGSVAAGPNSRAETFTNTPEGSRRVQIFNGPAGSVTTAINSNKEKANTSDYMNSKQTQTNEPSQIQSDTYSNSSNNAVFSANSTYGPAVAGPNSSSVVVFQNADEVTRVFINADRSTTHFGPFSHSSITNHFPASAPQGRGVQQKINQRVYHLGMSEKLSLPAGSSNCTIHGGMSGLIHIGDNSKDMTIHGGMSGKIFLGSNCSNVNVHLAMSATLQVGSGSRDIRIHRGMSSTYTLGSNCSDIKVDGGRIC